MKIWDIQNTISARTIPIQGADRNIYEVSFSPDGKNLAYIGEGSIYNQGNLYIMKVSPKTLKSLLCNHPYYFGILLSNQRTINH